MPSEKTTSRGLDRPRSFRNELRLCTGSSNGNDGLQAGRITRRCSIQRTERCLNGTIATVPDKWKVRWSEFSDKSARSVEDMWASNPLTSEAAARDQFMSMKNVATGLGYRCVQLMNGDATVDQWEAESGTSTD